MRRIAAWLAATTAIALAACAPEPAPAATPAVPVAAASPARAPDSVAVPPAAAATAGAANVRAFVAAFDRHDVDALIALAHPQIEWMSVQGKEISTELDGTPALRDWLSSYFARTPGARSRLLDVGGGGRWVTATECARSGKEGASESCSSSVYELEQGKVRRVWYFPSETAPQ